MGCNHIQGTEEHKELVYILSKLNITVLFLMRATKIYNDWHSLGTPLKNLKCYNGRYIRQKPDNVKKKKRVFSGDI